MTTAVYNLALLNASLGDLAEASRLQRRAIGTWERTMGREHPLVARALFTFAQTLAEQGRDRQALPFYERAQSISERSLGLNHPTVARVLSYHATSLARIGQTRRASELSARAIRIWDGSDAREAGATADALLRYAHIQADLGDYKAAMQSFDRALSIQLPLLGAAHPAIAETQAARSKVMAGLGESTNALPVAIEAEDIGRGHLRLTLGYLPERQALGYASKRPRGLDVALSIVSERSVTPVLDALIKGRSLIVDEIARRRKAATQAPERELLPLWSAVSAASQRLANLVIRGPSGQRPEQYVAVLDEARHEKEAAERALAEKSVAFGSDLARAEIGLEQVGAALPADSALISFVPVRPHDRARTIITRGRRVQSGAGTTAQHRSGVSCVRAQAGVRADRNSVGPSGHDGDTHRAVAIGGAEGRACRRQSRSGSGSGARVSDDRCVVAASHLGSGAAALRNGQARLCRSGRRYQSRAICRPTGRSDAISAGGRADRPLLVLRAGPRYYR